MARKELSPYAPDVWIRQLNRTYPNLWTDLRKVYAEPEKILNSKSGGVSLIKNVPDWCIMPTLFSADHQQIRGILLSHAHG